MLSQTLHVAEPRPCAHGSAMNAHPGEPHFFGRNRLCVAPPGQRWCKYDEAPLLKTAGQLQPGHASVVRYRHMEIDDAHFGCSFFREYPDPIVAWKWPENGDCSGGLALNLAQAIMNRISCAPPRRVGAHAHRVQHESSRTRARRETSTR